jgi:DNA polymerase III epsilon subunit-like protein
MRNNDTNITGTPLDTKLGFAPLNLTNLPQALGLSRGIDPDSLPESFIFYDVETTGLNPQFDQILQFAAIRTDRDFNIVDELEDIVDIRCNILPWVVPSPGALLKTRVMPDDLTAQSLSFYQVMDRIQNILERWQRPRPPLDDKGNTVDTPHIFSGGGPVFLGYNSLKFDEEFLRNALFQSLHAPYLTHSRLSSRADVLKMLQAVHVLEPGAITIPEVYDERTGTNRISFKLGDVCTANGIDLSELQAHDALADVKATIALAKLIREKAPQVFQLMIDNCNKRNVLNSALGNWSGIAGIDPNAKAITGMVLGRAETHAGKAQGTNEIIRVPFLEKLVTPDRLFSILNEINQRQIQRKGSELSRIAALDREAAEAEAALNNLYSLIEKGIVQPQEATLRTRLSDLTEKRNVAVEARDRARAQLSEPINLDAAKLDQFAKALRKGLTEGDVSARKAWITSVVDAIVVNDTVIRVIGQKSHLNGPLKSGGPTPKGVHSSVQAWCRKRDSNPRPHHYE